MRLFQKDFQRNVLHSIQMPSFTKEFERMFISFSQIKLVTREMAWIDWNKRARSRKAAGVFIVHGFWYFAQSRSREIQVYPRNPAKFTKTCVIPQNSVKILPNTCRYNIFETYLGYWGCLLSINLPIYIEISSPPRVNITYHNYQAF